ncbi:hypothetical protein UGMREWDR_CDS0138 [Aeromonas phage GomatiRiver_11]|nr:hypothetical protein OBDJBBDK_00130 [Aeromonas phage AhFM11]WKW84305.1 hypothetical protein UGMREWDR_CDS0138 [Aeromonas phage GomatiRiver_11]
MQIILNVVNVQQQFQWMDNSPSAEQSEIIDLIKSLDPELAESVQLSAAEYSLIREYL